MSDPIVPSGAPASSAPSSAPADTGTSRNTETGQFEATTDPSHQPTQATAKVETKPAAQKPPVPKKYKLKIDGKDEELGEEDVVKWAQMGRASQKRFQEAAQQKKQAEDFIKMLKENPAEVLSNPAIGVDIRKFAEEYLVKQLEREQLSPEQMKIRDLEEEIKRRDEDKKKTETQKQQEQQKQLEQHFAQDYDKKITEALQTGGLPKSPKTIKRMADYMMVAVQNNLDLQPKDVIALVRQDYLSEINDLFSQTEGDALLQILGDGVANKIRKADLARLRAGSAPITPAPQAAAPVKDDVPPKEGHQPKNIYEWREEIDRRVRGK